MNQLEDKIMNFLYAFPRITWHCIKGWVLSLKEIWTSETVLWSFDQTYFHGKNSEFAELYARREKFQEDYKNLIK